MITVDAAFDGSGTETDGRVWLSSRLSSAFLEAFSWLSPGLSAGFPRGLHLAFLEALL
jgi:hypothetical protein